MILQDGFIYASKVCDQLIIKVEGRSLCTIIDTSIMELEVRLFSAL